MYLFTAWILQALKLVFVMTQSNSRLLKKLFFYILLRDRIDKF